MFGLSKIRSFIPKPPIIIFPAVPRLYTDKKLPVLSLFTSASLVAGRVSGIIIDLEVVTAFIASLILFDFLPIALFADMILVPGYLNLSNLYFHSRIIFAGFPKHDIEDKNRGIPWTNGRTRSSSDSVGLPPAETTCPLDTYLYQREEERRRIESRIFCRVMQ